MAKSLGITGTVTVGSQDYECESASCKLEMEKIEYAAIGGNGWQIQVPGGVKKAAGSIEFPFDNSIGIPDISAGSLVSVVFNISDSHSISFQAALYDVDVKKTSKGLTKCTCNYESSGVVTYA